VEATEDDNEEIDVVKIMERIRENIRRRKESGASAGCEVMDQTLVDGSSGEIEKDLGYINSNWDIQNNSYYISSHRPVMGKAMVRGRELVHGEVRRYVDPMVFKQNEFNGSTVRILNEAVRRFDEIASKLDVLENMLGQLRGEIEEKIGQARTEIGEEIDERLRGEIEEKIGQARTELGEDIDERLRGEIEEKIGQARTEIGEDIDERLRGEIEEKIGQARIELGEEIDERLRSVVAAMNEDIENKAWLASILERRKDSYDLPASTPAVVDGMNYFVFEERFRGPRKDVKLKQLAFVDYFEGCKHVLDIGCGRGEFLELLGDDGIGARGIDVDENMIDYCISRGLDVENVDAVEYLENIEDKSIDGIFLDQVVEHLEPGYLIKLLDLCYRKLKYGYYIIMETVNPLSFVSFANFYIDMTHKKPVHPSTLKFLLESAGFREIETKFFSPLNDEARLRKIDMEGGMEEGQRRQIEIYNQNIDMLNNILYGAQDYAMIGKK